VFHYQTPPSTPRTPRSYNEQRTRLNNIRRLSGERLISELNNFMDDEAVRLKTDVSLLSRISSTSEDLELFQEAAELLKSATRSANKNNSDSEDEPASKRRRIDFKL